jgi:hypothetical protein
MIGRKHGVLASLVVAPLALGLAACGGGSSDEVYYCPQPLTVADADRLTHFKDGAGRDPRDVAYEAVLSGARSACSAGRGQVNVTLFVRVAAAAGPSVSAGTTSVPYFVRVLDAGNRVVQSQEFTADFRLTPSKPRASSQEELVLRLPFTQPTDVAGYRIAVGLRPSQDELNYNRRGRSGG